MTNYQLSIITANGAVFNDQVESLIAPGALGSFGVLSNHAPFVTSLCRGPVTVTQNGTENYFAISSGILEVNTNNNVLLLAEYARKVNTIDEAKAEGITDDGKK